ncbi:nicotinate phosphoribosyltransferase-like [Oppia nitens]|uniref:nicotinate phosphoribosyltransferase-like n=1 Tax=Oppia nitens TaxID=1686743 RepID=UPI0023DC2550|nr:nicotinate phosphoribosyltransferase-like [Oppia nitens]
MSGTDNKGQQPLPTIVVGCNDNNDKEEEEEDEDHHHSNGSIVDCCKSIHLPLLTDMYQITMAYAYWKSPEKRNQLAVFDMFFRKNPFGGEFTIFSGLDEVIKFLQGFRFTTDDIKYLRQILPDYVEDEFFQYLSQLSAKDIRLYAIREGSVVFPKVPLMRVEGPLPVAQLLETTLLTLVNFASLITTNAARYKIALDGRDIRLYEFGLRRAQGIDGGLSASKYAYMGGFDGTSNVLAGKMYGIPLKGTHAHSFVMSYSSLDELNTRYLLDKTTGQSVDFVSVCLKYQNELSQLLDVLQSEISSSELTAFIAYAISFPDQFLALVDTYDMIRSGLLNFSSVALALNQLGYRALGIRIDSGDLAYQSVMAYKAFKLIGQTYSIDWFGKLAIVASNDINEDTIISLKEQKHRINAFGIGTHLVTCQRQPALGCVYKLVEINSHPCIKISLDVQKVTVPGRKRLYRLYGKEGFALIDLMQNDSVDEPEPLPLTKVLCRHPFQESKRCYATPSKVEPLLEIWWQNGKIQKPMPTLDAIRNHVQQSLDALRPDIKRYLNPTPYKVSVTDNLYQFMHNLWLENAPVGELN